MSALTKISVDVELCTVNCGCCGGTYAINERYRQTAYAKGDSWTCPYCKTGWGYGKDNENARLKKQVEELSARNQRSLERANSAEHANRELSKQLKGTKTRMRNLKTRVHNGVCPCCSRTFTNLQRHMATKHPEYGAGE